MNSPDGSDGPTSAQPAGSELTITVRPSEQAAATTWKLQCDPAGGDHPDSAGACAAIAKAKNPFEPVPKDAICTQIYGGPETATVVGTWNGKQVNATFKRTDGCEIARWQQLAAVFQPGTGSGTGTGTGSPAPS